MHPILARPGRLGLYLAGWLPLTPLLALVLRAGELTGGWRPWGEALALGLPLSLLYAQLCLASWYVCRLAPLAPAAAYEGESPRQPLRSLSLQLVAAVLSSLVWVALARGLADLLAPLFAPTDLADRMEAASFALFVLGVPLYGTTAAAHYLILAFDRSREAERRRLRLEIQAREAELKALRSQLDPHFLFNSLNTIGALVTSEPQAARKMSILLAEFLRRGLRAGELAAVPLAEELAHAAGYLAIERIRFGDRLRVEQEIAEEARACRVPPFLLQPLVENAVRHGIAQLLEGGAVRITADRHGDELLLTIENPCDPEHPAPRGEGVGLANVRARLAAVYGARAALAVATPPGAFRVEIHLPAEDVESPGRSTIG